MMVVGCGTESGDGGILRSDFVLDVFSVAVAESTFASWHCFAHWCRHCGNVSICMCASHREMWVPRKMMASKGDWFIDDEETEMMRLMPEKYQDDKYIIK